MGLRARGGSDNLDLEFDPRRTYFIVERRSVYRRGEPSDQSIRRSLHPDEEGSQG